MTKLSQLLEAVKDENLDLATIEKYRDELVHLHSAMQIELAGIEKEEALFFLRMKQSGGSPNEKPDIVIKRLWRGTEKGQRGIELNRYVKAVSKEIDSLKSRVYRLI